MISLPTIRDRIVSLLRWKHWGPVLLTIAIVAMALAVIKESDPKSRFAGTVALWSLVLGTLAQTVEYLRRFRVWRWLVPSTRGLDGITRRIDDSPLFKAAFMTPDLGETSIDAPAVITHSEDLLNRIDFVGDDPALNAIAARINASAFRGTVYQASSDQKMRRNRPLARKQPASFALIRKDDRYEHAGLAVVLPMNTTGINLYLAGRLSDNDIAPRHLADPGERPEALLVFLVANASHGVQKARRNAYPQMLDELVQTCIIQIIALAATASTSRKVRVVVANAERKWRAAFERMNFEHCIEYGSADQQTVYECRIRVQGAKRAMLEAEQMVPGIMPTGPIPVPPPSEERFR